MGVLFDLSECCTEVPVLVVKNTEDRIKEIRAEIKERLHTSQLSAAQASQLRGRLVFANSQTFGRMGAMAFHYLGRRAHMIGASKKMDVELRWALEWWHTHMGTAKERRIQITNVRRPLYIFTDGSCEPDAQKTCGITAGYGAVMYDPEDNAYEFFQGEIGTPLKTILTLNGQKKQIVGQAEILPCLAARHIWTDRMKGRPVLCFIDNDAARYALIKGSSPTPDSAWLSAMYWEKETAVGSYSWFERVPSPSNIADAPSRGEPPATLVGTNGFELKPKEVFLPVGFERLVCLRFDARANRHRYGDS